MMIVYYSILGPGISHGLTQIPPHLRNQGIPPPPPPPLPSTWIFKAVNRVSRCVPLVNLNKTQLLYGCSERILPLSPAEIVRVHGGTLDPTSVIRPSPDDPSLAGSGHGGSGAGYGTSAGTVDTKSLELVSLLRNKSYAMFTPAERMRLLRGLCDLAASTGPIKEHLQVRVELNKEACCLGGGWGVGGCKRAKRLTKLARSGGGVVDAVILRIFRSVLRH